MKFSEFNRVNQCSARVIFLAVAFVMMGCDEPAPEAVSASMAVPATTDKPAGARAPTLDSSRQPKPSAEESCSTLQREAATLASKCFRVVPDKAACAAFHEVIAELNESGCVDPDMGQSRVGDMGAAP